MNRTNSTEYVAPVLGEIEKVIIQIFSVVFLALALYLCFVLTWYEAISKKQQYKANRNHHNNWMRILCLVTSYTFLPRIVPRCFGYFYEIKEEFCPVFYHLTNVPLFLMNIFVYGILFIKQHSLYTARVSVEFPFKSVLSAYGKFVYTLYVICNCLIMTTLVFVVRTGLKKYGFCAMESMTFDISYMRRGLVASMVVTQVSLLTLYAFPLVKHSMTNRALRGKENTLIKLVKNSALITLICVVTDVGVYGLMMEVISNLVIHSMLYNISILVNIYSVVFIFKDWKQRLFPFNFNKKSPALRTATEKSKAKPTSI